MPLPSRVVYLTIAAVLFLIAGVLAASSIHAQPPAVIAATSTAAAQTAEALYATAAAQNAVPPSGTPFTPRPTATAVVAPTPANAPATETVAARTAEAGLAAVETTVLGNTATSVPSVVSTTPTTTPMPALLPNTGRNSGTGWPVSAMLAGIAGIAFGMALRRRRMMR